MIKRTLQLGLAAIVLTAPVSASAETTLEKAKRTGYVTVGFSNEIPFSYADGEKLTGADMEVLKAVLSRMGIKEVVGVLTEFQSLIPGLQAERFDITAGMYIRPNRCARILFTNPLETQGDMVIVKAGNPKKIHSYEDVAKDTTIRIGYLAGGTGISEHIVAAGVAADRLVTFPDPASAIAGLKSDRIDAFASTASGNQALLDKLDDSSLERASPFEQPTVNGKPSVGYVALGFRKADADFVKAFNGQLAGFLGTPEHLDLVRKFSLHEDDVKPALSITADDICKG
jgi:polar amino acid transport system substrate-binding protein